LTEPPSVRVLVNKVIFTLT
jgi:hypothetical protein